MTRRTELPMDRMAHFAPETCLGCGDVDAAHRHCDGLCEACHPGIDTTQRRRRTGYVSPDAYERNGEYYDHAADANRQRVVDNTGAVR